MAEKAWDVVIVGGGAAGLSAALMLGRSRRRVLVIDSGQPRNRFAEHMHGVLGQEGTPPLELLARGRAEAAAYDVEFRAGTVQTVRPIGRGVVVVTEFGEIPARALVVASGMTDELPDIPGLADHWGTKVLHCPYCHGFEVRDQRIGVLTTSPLSLHHAEMLRQWTDDLTVFTAGLGEVRAATEQRLRARGVTLVPGAVLEVSTQSDGALAVRTDDGVTTVDAIFTAGTPRTHESFLGHLRLARTETPFGSYLAVDQAGKTSDGRVWAAGNVVNPMLNVPMSMGAGSQVGGAVNGALVSEDFDLAVSASAQWPQRAEDGFWEERYASVGSTWSGRPNQALVQTVANLAPGRALDIGCGEGGDVIWLAQQGWQATGIDVAPTAIARAQAAAERAGVPDGQARFIAADGAAWPITEEFDLVTTSFLHGSSGGSRQEIMRRAAAAVAPGGHLLLISHAPMPWMAHHDGEDSGHSHFLSPAEEIAALGLDADNWTTQVAESRTRQSLGPDGQVFDIDDTVVLLTKAR